MTGLEICLLCGGAMTAFMFINFFVSSWVLCFAIILLALGMPYNHADAGQSFLVCGGGGGSGGLYSTVRNQEIQRRLIIPGKIKRSLIYELPHTIAFI